MEARGTKSLSDGAVQLAIATILSTIIRITRRPFTVAVTKCQDLLTRLPAITKLITAGRIPATETAVGAGRAEEIRKVRDDRDTAGIRNRQQKR